MFKGRGKRQDELREVEYFPQSREPIALSVCSVCLSKAPAKDISEYEMCLMCVEGIGEDE